MRRISLLHKSEITRIGMATALQSVGIPVEGSFSTVSEFLDSLSTLPPPEILISGAKFADSDIFELLEAVWSLGLETDIIVLLQEQQYAIVDQLMDRGVKGAITEACPLHTLENAVRAITCGGLFIDQRLRSTTLTTKTTAQPTKSFAGLTQREMQVLGLVCEGMTNGQIAQRLAIGRETVKTHVRNITDKLGARDRTEAAVIAIQRNRSA